LCAIVLRISVIELRQAPRMTSCHPMAQAAKI
jgi:hypothetical protein